MEFITQNSTIIILVVVGIVAIVATYWKQISSALTVKNSQPVVKRDKTGKTHEDITNELVEGMYFARSIGNKELQESNYKALKTHFDVQQVTE